MLKSYVYIPDELNKKIELVVKAQKKSKAAIIREALMKGIDPMQREKGASAQALLRLAELGEKYTVKGPKDLSGNLNKYAWGREERNKCGK